MPPIGGPDSSAPSLAQTQVMTGPSAIDAANFTAPTQAGNYFFWCDVDPTIMTGNSVTVSASSTVDSVVVNVVGVSTPGFSPSNVTVKVGGRVRWVNSTGIAHAVENQ